MSSWNRPWFINYVLCVSSLSRPWFIYWFNFVGFIVFGCIYYFIGCLWFLCFVYRVNLLFWWNRRIDGFLHHIRFFSFFTMEVFPYLTTASVVVTNAFLISSKSPLIFLIFSLGLSDYLGNGPMLLDDMISVFDLLHPVNSRISSML